MPTGDEGRLRLHHGERPQRNRSWLTLKYGCKLLVWYERYDDLQQARLRELQMKKWKRLWKLSTIELMNPEWRDLYPTLT